MNLLAIYHPLAEDELNDVARYYAMQDRPGLAHAFLFEVQRVVRLAVAKPGAGRLLHRDVRSWKLRKFPYSVIYRVTPSTIRVLAIAGHRRRPAYWTERL